MSEPTLNDIEDYNTLGGEKKRVVLAVIMAGLIIGSIFGIAKFVYDGPEDTIKTENIVKSIPLK